MTALLKQPSEERPPRIAASLHRSLKMDSSFSGVSSLDGRPERLPLEPSESLAGRLSSIAFCSMSILSLFALL